MPISTIQFNGSNAYSFAPGEFITSREFGIVNMDDIAFGAEVFASNASAKLRATMRFINSAGNLLSTSAQTYTPTVLNLWERAVFTWPVPANAVRCELRLEGVTSTILMAQPKVANGTDPGSYGSNWSPQLTFLTPTGIYTGTLSAKQIILSAGEDLSDRLVTINANQILMSSKLDNRTTKITNEGVYTGEIVADQVKTGLLKSTNGASEINMDNGSFSFGNGAFTFTPLNGTVMGGWSTSPTKMEKTITDTLGPFDAADKERVRQIVIGTITPTQSDLQRFDVNSDGVISIIDKYVIDNMVKGVTANPTIRTYKVGIGGVDPKKMFYISGTFESTYTSDLATEIGSGLVKTNTLHVSVLIPGSTNQIIVRGEISSRYQANFDTVYTYGLYLTHMLLENRNGDLYWNGKKVLTT